jgi:uncharacterized protein involved in outer membrane biogenesis
MQRNIVAGAVVALFLIAIGMFVWARSILATDSVRTAIAAQLSEAIGQPVAIGGIGVTIVPRVTVNLEQVAIGQPPRIQVDTLHVGTSFGALLSRRIEHGALRLSGARIELPLPPLGAAPVTRDTDTDVGPSLSSGAASAGVTPDLTIGPTATSAEVQRRWPVEIVSIDEIVLSDVEIVSGGRTLRGDIEAALEGQGVTLRKIELAAADTSISASGRITDLSAPAGELTLKAGALNIDQLLAFAADFAGAARPGTASTPAGRPAAGGTRPPMNISVSLDAERASLGGLTIDTVTGRARLTPDLVTVDPIAFGLFGGRYDGAMAVRLSPSPQRTPVAQSRSGTSADPALTAERTSTFRWTATLTGVDVAAATAFAGSPDTVSGRLSGKIDLSGSGADAATALRTARGTVRLDIVDGVVKRLGLVRSVVLATSMRDGAVKAASGGSTDEPFTRLGATFSIGGGAAATDDLRFESKDLLLNAAGSVRLDATAVNLAGKVQLSDELTRQAGSDLVRYTAEEGRVTLPATITGPADNLRVRIDVADMARRAITNRATEEAQERLKGGLGGLIRRP